MTKNASPDPRAVEVRLAQTPEEIIEAQRIRYRVFYEEYGAKADPKAIETGLDQDKYDDYADHLVVVDSYEDTPKIVGTYRLLQQSAAEKCGQFYTSDEFDISPLLDSGMSVLELGRSCVLDAYRTRPVLNLLWQGIADYITEHNIDVMFGCASLHTTNIDEIAEQLSYLKHFHAAPAEICPKAIESRYVEMNIVPEEELNAKRVFASLPPLIKGYLRLGGAIGDGAVIDHDFNTTDVCVLVQTHLVTQRYRKHYERKIQRSMPDRIVSKDLESETIF